MTEAHLERRRHPRVVVQGSPPEFSIPTALTVQLLEISQHGVLLSSPQRMEVGQRAQLRTRVGSEPLTMLVEIRRVTTGSRQGPGPWRLGAQIVSVDQVSQQKIDRFLGASL